MEKASVREFCCLFFVWAALKVAVQHVLVLTPLSLLACLFGYGLYCVLRYTAVLLYRRHHKRRERR